MPTLRLTLISPCLLIYITLASRLLAFSPSLRRKSETSFIIYITLGAKREAGEAIALLFTSHGLPRSEKQALVLAIGYYK